MHYGKTGTSLGVTYLTQQGYYQLNELLQYHLNPAKIFYLSHCYFPTKGNLYVSEKQFSLANSNLCLLVDIC